MNWEWHEINNKIMEHKKAIDELGRRIDEINCSDSAIQAMNSYNKQLCAESCWICGKENNGFFEGHHLLANACVGSNKFSEIRDRFIVHVCRSCHHLMHSGENSTLWLIDYAERNKLIEQIDEYLILKQVIKIWNKFKLDELKTHLNVSEMEAKQASKP